MASTTSNQPRSEGGKPLSGSGEESTSSTISEAEASIMSPLNSKADSTKKVEDDQVSDKIYNRETAGYWLGMSTVAAPAASDANATTTSPNTPPTCCITTLSNELLYQITDQLHPVESVCLGLTCKALYPLHKFKNPKVRLWEYVVDKDSKENKSGFYFPQGTTLAKFLRSWIPSTLTHNYWESRFESKEKFRELYAKKRTEAWYALEINALWDFGLFIGFSDKTYDDMIDEELEDSIHLQRYSSVFAGWSGGDWTIWF